MENELQKQEFQAAAALYALGSLSHHEARAFELELQSAEESAQDEAAAYAAVVSHLSAAAPEAIPSTGVRDALLARIENDPSQSLLRSQPGSTNQTGLDVFENDGQWTQVYEGVSVKKLYRDPKTEFSTCLYKLEPGAYLPNHKHFGSEQCFMISGDFVVNGITYREGDFTVALEKSTHYDLYSIGGATVLIISPPKIELI